MAGGAPPEGGARAASLDLEDSGGRGALTKLGVVRVPIEPSGRSTAREGRWIFKVGPERERCRAAFDDCPDMGTRVLEPCGPADGVIGGLSDDDDSVPLLSHVGTGTERPFGPT